MYNTLPIARRFSKCSPERLRSSRTIFDGITLIAASMSIDATPLPDVIPSRAGHPRQTRIGQACQDLKARQLCAHWPGIRRATPNVHPHGQRPNSINQTLRRIPSQWTSRIQYAHSLKLYPPQAPHQQDACAQHSVISATPRAAQKMMVFHHTRAAPVAAAPSYHVPQSQSRTTCLVPVTKITSVAAYIPATAATAAASTSSHCINHRRNPCHRWSFAGRDATTPGSNSGAWRRW